MPPEPRVELPELEAVWCLAGNEYSYHVLAKEDLLTREHALEVIRRCADYALLKSYIQRQESNRKTKGVR